MPSLGNKTVGLNVKVAMGYFSYKQTFSLYNLADDYHEVQSASGIGAMAGVGFYLNVWKMGVAPSFNLIYSGNSESSFAFYGYTLPVTFTF